MRISIVAVGRAKRGPERDLFEFYSSRVGWPITLLEVEERRAIGGAERKTREAELIAAKIPVGAILVAMDERGEDLTSRKFAKLLGDWQDAGASDVAFIIGGADGLIEDLRAQARKTIRFGRATWPHMMVRSMLAEQIYRARRILEGHPYHRD